MTDAQHAFKLTHNEAIKYCLEEIKSFAWMEEYFRDISFKYIEANYFTEDAEDDEKYYTFEATAEDYNGEKWLIPIVYSQRGFEIDMRPYGCQNLELNPENYWAYLFGCAQDRLKRRIIMTEDEKTVQMISPEGIHCGSYIPKNDETCLREPECRPATQAEINAMVEKLVGVPAEIVKKLADELGEIIPPRSCVEVDIVPRELLDECVRLIYSYAAIDGLPTLEKLRAILKGKKGGNNDR